MWLSNLKVFGRNFRRQRTVGVLSIAGLAVAVAVVVLIGMWAMNEFRFDNFHRDGENISRLVVKTYLSNESALLGGTFRPFGEEAQAKLPDIQEMCRVADWEKSEIQIDDVLYGGDVCYIVDSNFYSFFTFPLKTGDVRTVLSAPDQMVISESMGRKYFQAENPVGKVIRYSGRNWKVAGVMYDMPENSHLKADFVVPPFGYTANCSWGDSDGFMTYFKLRPGTDPSSLEKPLVNILCENMVAFKNISTSTFLQPLKDIHFSVGFHGDTVVKGNKPLVLIFLLMSWIVLIIACINFVNLFVSTSFLRAKSVGVKKAHGADKMSLVREFYLETFFYMLSAVICGMVIAKMILPFFNQMANAHVRIDLTSPLLYLLLGSVLLLTSLIAGLFPALYTAKFGVVETLRGQFKGKNLSVLQKGLIITQFTASIVFLIAVFFINKQVDYMVNKDLGFDKENVVCMYGRDGLAEHYKTVRDELLTCPSVVGVTEKRGLPTEWMQGWETKRVGMDESYTVEICRVREDYFDVLKMPVVQGENPFLKSHDSLHYCVINERAARMMGMENPLGESLEMYGQLYPIKAVVKDAQTKSLRQNVDAQVYLKLSDNSDYRYGCTYLVRVAGDPQQAIKAMEAQWKEQVPKAPFEYQFLDQVYEHLYTAETNAGKVLSSVMMITLLISVAGLFAMAFYSTQRRVKEIGVRKVNGAGAGEILMLLNRDFLVWVVISFCIACPVAYFIVSRWLEGFQERTDMSWWVFALVGILVLLVALLTVSYQTWKAASVNPVKALKSE